MFLGQIIIANTQGHSEMGHNKTYKVHFPCE